MILLPHALFFSSLSSSSLPPLPSCIIHFLSPEYFSDISGVQFFCFYISSVSSLLLKCQTVFLLEVFRFCFSEQGNDRTALMSLPCKYPTFKTTIGRQRACAMFPAIHLNEMKFLKSSQSKWVGAGYIPP